MIKHEVTHCKNCLFAAYSFSADKEEYYCNVLQQTVLFTGAYDTDSVDDKEIPDECPLFDDEVTVKLSREVPRPYNPDADFDRLCNDADEYIKSRKE